MTQLPDGVEPYARSPLFTAKSVPHKLLATHDLKVGTWGRLNVTQGTVRYFITGQDESHLITAPQIHIITPQEKHYIEPSDDAEFFIEFCAQKRAS